MCSVSLYRYVLGYSAVCDLGIHCSNIRTYCYFIVGFKNQQSTIYQTFPTVALTRNRLRVFVSWSVNYLTL